MSKVIKDIQIQFKQGAEANLPELAIGEPAVTTDNSNFYVGTTSGNKQIAFKDEVGKIASEITNDIIGTEVLPTQSKTVKGAITEVFTCVSNGKITLARAITDMGISTLASDPFEVMAENIKQIATKIENIKVTTTSGYTMYSATSDDIITFIY